MGDQTTKTADPPKGDLATAEAPPVHPGPVRQVITGVVVFGFLWGVVFLLAKLIGALLGLVFGWLSEAGYEPGSALLLNSGGAARLLIVLFFIYVFVAGVGPALAEAFVEPMDKNSGFPYGRLSYLYSLVAVVLLPAFLATHPDDPLEPIVSSRVLEGLTAPWFLPTALGLGLAAAVLTAFASRIRKTATFYGILGGALAAGVVLGALVHVAFELGFTSLT